MEIRLFSLLGFVLKEQLVIHSFNSRFIYAAQMKYCYNHVHLPDCPIRQKSGCLYMTLAVRDIKLEFNEDPTKLLSFSHSLKNPQ